MRPGQTAAPGVVKVTQLLYWGIILPKQLGIIRHWINIGSYQMGNHPQKWINTGIYHDLSSSHVSLLVVEVCSFEYRCGILDSVWMMIEQEKMTFQIFRDVASQPATSHQQTQKIKF